MKKFKKLFSIMFGCALAMTSLVGCGGGGTAGGGEGGSKGSTLKISIFHGGYGTDWVDDMISLYEEKFPGQKAKKEVIFNSSDAIAQLKSGTTDFDLYFSKEDIFRFVLRPVTCLGTTYETLVADLTDIYNEKIPGEDKTIKEKMSSTFIDTLEVEKNGEQHFYSTPWAVGIIGLIKNNNIWDPNWGEMRTTDEMFETFDNIKESGAYPFIYSLTQQYIDLFTNIWFYQYDGMETYNNYWNGIDSLGRKNKPELLLYEGRLESLKVAERLLNDSNKYTHPLSKSIDFTTAQNYFLEGEIKGKTGAPLTVNGDWMNGELLYNYEEDEINLEMIKTPIVSALGTKLGITDTELRNAIDFIDGKTTEQPVFAKVAEGMTAESVIAKIREARGINLSSSFGHQAWIPIYAKHQDEAKNFLQLMASDEGIEVFMKATHGHILPYEFDYNTKNTFQSKYLQSTNRFLMDSLKDDNDDERIIASFVTKGEIWSLGGLSATYKTGCPSGYVSAFAASNPSDYMSPDDVYMNDYKNAKSRWDSYLAAI